MSKRLGEQTVALSAPVVIAGGAAVGGKKEGAGPLRERFDTISEDSYFGQKSWEKAESVMLRQCFQLLCQKTETPANKLDFILSGDLQSQCTGSAFALRDAAVPYLGLYGACSTMGESLALGAMLIDGGAAERVCAMTCSHFCSAERQFRLPLEYGGQRTPTAQWTATAAGAVLLRKGSGCVRITHVTPGKIVDAGITDANNMGAAMAPAAWDTLRAHFKDTGREGSYYDAVITGDLGHFGHDILADLAHEEGMTFPNIFTDCGILLYSAKTQDVHSGGSGCGCSASVFAGHILKCLQEGMWHRVLFAPTGALMSTVTSQQGESIPGICHAIAIEAAEET
ncbi:MAG: stage V sporulation protein AD [Ruminococcaceae bacterium]|nr:stage V sporulation protein AD [Oscillospiraceae bacterium]